MYVQARPLCKRQGAQVYIDVLAPARGKQKKKNDGLILNVSEPVEHSDSAIVSAAFLIDAA